MLKPFRSFHSQYNNHSDQFQKLLQNPLHMYHCTPCGLTLIQCWGLFNIRKDSQFPYKSYLCRIRVGSLYL